MGALKISIFSVTHLLWGRGTGSRPSEGVPEFPRLKDVREVWFSDIFSLKILTIILIKVNRMHNRNHVSIHHVNNCDLEISQIVFSGQIQLQEHNSE